IKSVFDSWHNKRAVTYRNLYGIDEKIGTAVNVQSMVFGNLNEESGTGVLFTRNPITGANEIFGEYLLNAQGEDVVAGLRTPQPISVLKKQMPEVYEQLHQIVKNLENSYKDVQDVEFTIENKKLYLLQTRSAKRTSNAALKIAIDFYNEGIVDKITAITMIAPEQIEQLLHPSFDPLVIKDTQPISKGLPASPGAAYGKIYFDAKKVVEMKNKGEDTILIRMDTSPDDIEGLIAANAILTSTGGMTSHAAVVARGMGRTCVVGCMNIEINNEAKTAQIGELLFNEGDYISIDGSTGNVYQGKIATLENSLPKQFNTLMEWANEYSLMNVLVNADNAADAQKGLDFGARGIGLCRTEHMFFNKDRIIHMQKM
ncbi:MAG: PEP/pyruvate-binding domain-containing protein, partial [Bacilli bacterium]